MSDKTCSGSRNWRGNFLLGLCLALGAGDGFGFGDLGHRLVGALAQDMLGPRARAKMAQVLGPEGGAVAVVDGMRLPALARAATWADEIRMLRPETRPWHYVTLQLAEPGYDPARAGSPNVVIACNRALRTLRDPGADRYAREEALKWAAHLIGDLHQPLHVGEDHDKGGNLAQVKLGRRSYNLHQVWDHALLERLNLDFESLRSMLARDIAADPAFLRRNARGTVEDWVNETHRKTAQCYLLHGKAGGKAGEAMRKGGKVALDRDYARAATLTVLEQIKIAAARLAFAVNGALDPGGALSPPAASPAGAGPDYFAKADTSEAAGRGRPPEPPAAARGRFAWSVHSQVYHFAECAAVGKIKRKNLHFSDTPPPGMELHAGCPSAPQPR